MVFSVGIAFVRAVASAAVRDDVPQDLFNPGSQLRHTVAAELIKALKGPEVNVLNDVGAVDAGTQTLSEQPLGLPAHPGPQLRKQSPQGLCVTLPRLGQEAGQFVIVVHGDSRDGLPTPRRMAPQPPMTGQTQTGEKVLQIVLVFPRIPPRAVVGNEKKRD
jgi:hypothetical protein